MSVPVSGPWMIRHKPAEDVEGEWVMGAPGDFLFIEHFANLSWNSTFQLHGS